MQKEKHERLQQRNGMKSVLFPMVTPTNIFLDALKGDTTTDIEISRECAICLCDIDDDDFVYNIRCHHAFHLECLEHWYSRRTTCPLCKQPIDFIVTEEHAYEFDRDVYDQKRRTEERLSIPDL